MSHTEKPAIIPKRYLLSFILTTCCFSLWGFANDFTNPLVKVFEQVFIITTSQASWLQFAFYTGYFCMAIPAVIFIRKFSYKSAIMLGLALYAGGALITIPASLTAQFALFCLASYVITYGLAFLETACNPYILAMGPTETATQRLNLAQSFNPIGSLTGMTVASLILAPSLEVTKLRTQIEEQAPAQIQYLVTGAETLPEGAVIDDGGETATLKDGESVTVYSDGIPDFKTVSGALGGAVPNVMKVMRANEPDTFNTLQETDLANVRGPYMVIAVVVSTFFFIFAFTKMPTFKQEEKDAPFLEITKRLFSRARFVEGVLAQLFYVGAQIMCWTYIYQYAEAIGISSQDAANYQFICFIVFLVGRAIGTYLLRFVNAGKLLFQFAIMAGICVLGTIFIKGIVGLYALVAISFFMSLMFPTIYGIALEDLDEKESKIGAAGLVMAIVGGALMPKLQGMIIDLGGSGVADTTIMGVSEVNFSFLLPFLCFIFIAFYGKKVFNQAK